MTTRAALNPVGGIRISSGGAVTMLIAALAVMTAVLLLAMRGGTGEVGMYETALSPVIERHNGAVADWNQFVSEHNATAVFSLGSYDAQSAKASAEVTNIVTEMELIRAEWAAIVPPISRTEPHALVLEALDLTLAGVSGVAVYFSSASLGDADYSQAQASLAMIDEASVYWAQAKSFEG
jgi:hypothetical protein